MEEYMLGLKFADVVRSLIERLRTEQIENVEAAGEMIAECWASGGAVFMPAPSAGHK